MIDLEELTSQALQSASLALAREDAHEARYQLNLAELGARSLGWKTEVPGRIASLRRQADLLLCMPGAPRFARYLNEQARKELGLSEEVVLTTKGPTVHDRSYDCDFAREWRVFANGEEIGSFRTFGLRPGQTQMERVFR